MSRPLLLLAALASTTILAPGSLSAPHEDDAKLLDRVPPIKGPGFRSNPPRPSQAGRLGAGGTGSLEFQSTGVHLLSWMPLDEFGSPANANDCWGYTSPGGREYALLGHYDGTGVVDVTDPGDPQLIANIAGPPSFFRDVKTYDEYAYAVTEGGGGIQVIDLTQADSGIATLANTITTGGVLSTHNVAINESAGYLYRCGGGTGVGLRIYDLSTPATPVHVATWSDRYVHDCNVVTMAAGPYAGQQLAFCNTGFNGGFDSTGLHVLDVTQPTNIQIVAEFTYTSPSYSHQCWLSDDQQYLYISDEWDEIHQATNSRTIVFDVSDPASPVELGTFSNGNEATDHNLYVRGDYIFEANFASGLRVFDRSNPSAPVEVGHFDTWPLDDKVGFHGLWSCFPFFASGVVVGSDVERGLFVWWIGDPPIDFDFGNGHPRLLNPDGHLLQVDVYEDPPGALDAGTLTLHYDAGAGWQELPLASAGGTTYEAQLPAFACGTPVAWYVSGATTAGITWNSPAAGAAEPVRSLAADVEVTVADHDFEVPAGWTGGVPGDDAVLGLWERGNPVGTPAQPEDDHSDPGVACWFTGQGVPGEYIANHDVDDGTTTLLSPLYDLSGATEAVCSYWRWFSNWSDAGPAPFTDVFVVQATDDDGANWVTVETVGPTGLEVWGDWFQHEFRVSDFVALTDQFRVRFVASDLGDGSIVEAAVDDFKLSVLDCSCDVVRYCSPAVTNSSGGPGTLSWQGSTSASANDLVLVADSLPAFHNGLMIYSIDQASIPLGDGLLCLGNQTHGFVMRLPFEASNGQGTMTHAFNINLPPHPLGKISAGETWNFQAWFRDVPAGMAGFNFSDGLAITFCP